MTEAYYKEILMVIHDFCLGKDVELPDDDIIEYLYNYNSAFRKEYDNDELIQIAVMGLMGKRRAMIAESEKNKSSITEIK